MRPSLGEIEATVRKAARGAGLPWGLAEEAGKALRWLAAHGIDGRPAFADLLDRHAAGLVSVRIAEADGRWSGADGPLCPVALGAALMDHALLPAPAIAAGPVLHPELLTPFVVRAAFEVAAEGGMVVCHRGAVADAAALWTRLGGALDAGGGEAWARLEAYAARTYVPASDQSRRRGAGAGVVDDD